MAATQAEPPNIPESSAEQEHQAPPVDMEHGGGPALQNGEKNNKQQQQQQGPGGGMMGPDVAVGPKGKMQNSMSPMDNMYRQEPPPGGPPQMNNNNDQQPPNNAGSGEDGPNNPNAENKMYPPSGEGPMAQQHPYQNRPNFAGRGGIFHPHPEMDHMNQMRHPGSYKPMPRGAGGMGPMQGGYPPQQRFISGQSISQPTGPTPTLNQLLQQSSNPGGHRYQGNRYGEPYSQNWPPPRGGGMPPYGAQQGPPSPYRNQPPMSSQPPSNYNANSSGDHQPPASPTNSPYPQRYHAPPSRQPYPQHPYQQQQQQQQAPGIPGQASSPGYDPQQQQQQQQQRQQWSAAQQQSGPHPPQSQSPHPPQAQSPQHTQARPQQSSTPNPHAPDPADISGQNSNDSVGGGPPTPTPSGPMRPTPSPTGSRSVSPAVGSYGPRPQYGGYNAQAPGPGYQQHQYQHMQQQYPGQQHPGQQQQGGYPGFNSGMPPSPSAYQHANANSSPHHSMGPPMGPPGASSAPPNSHPHEPMHPPNSSHPQMHSDSSSDSAGPPGLHDNGYASSGQGSAQPITSIVTTGPDGAPIDEASQQSTLSNASAASGGDDVSCTPKRRDMVPSPSSGMLGPMGGPGMGWGNRHPPTPHSPGSAPPMNSIPEEFTPTPAPVQAPTPSWSRAHTSHKHDSLSKLFDMDETPERRHFLEKLLSFMEERGTPISTCPTISKNLLDLFRLYLFVKERGGFLEVCRVNKNKIWKDIAGLLNIGASSSAAYTLRKHYIKNILPFECHFDRGGVDPQPIINQIEAATKKKGTKAAPTVPSPGSSNSQDSFPSGGGGSMDGYGGYGYPPDFNNQRGGPNQPPANYQGQNYPHPHPHPQYPDQYNQQYPPPNRAVYPYAPGPEGERSYNQSGPGQSGPPTQPGMPPGAQVTQEYRGGPYSPRGVYPGPGGAQQAAGAPPTPGPGGPNSQQFPQGATPPAQANQSPGATPQSQDYFRQDAPRRHPDFAKDQQQQQPPSPQSGQSGYPGPGYSGTQQSPMYPGWSGNQNNNQYRGPSYPPQQWNQHPSRPTGPGTNAPRPNQWGIRGSYPPNSQPSFPGDQQPAWAQNNNMRMMGPRGMDVRPPADPSKPFPPMQPAMKPGQTPPSAPTTGAVKREIQFPPDSVEAVTPVVYKRRKLGRADVAPVEAWRLMMALKSGLLAETCWAIDVLNILLFDDTGVAYFGLSHLPGLLDIILEHFKKSLSDMLESETSSDRKWYEPPKPDKDEPDLGIPAVTTCEPGNTEIVVTKSKSNFESRKKPVTTVESEDLFVMNGPRKWETFPFQSDEFESDTAYIIPCFRAENGNVPFVRILEGKPSYKQETSSKANTCVNSDVQKSVKIEIKSDEPDDKEANTTSEFKPRILDPAGNLKRRRLSDYEDESYCRDEASLYPVSDSQDNIARRCIALSNILRNLTFVPGNELEFSKNSTFLRLLGRLILAYHEHGLRATKTKNYERDDENDWADCCSSLSPQAESEWWWDYIENIRENVLVSMANIAGHIDLDVYPEDITRPILDGLLHWSVCPAAQGQDPFPSSSCSLSPQRLALEALCKLCVTDNNVDLVIATPPYSRLERLTYVLTRFLCKNEDQVLREFAVNLLHYLAAADSAMSRTIALQSPCISLLVAFIEQAEQNALGVANQHGICALRDNPDTMGTSLDMLRRTARTLLHLSKHPDNKPLFMQQEQRLLALVMSQILDQQVAAIISRVLYQTRPDLYQNR